MFLFTFYDLIKEKRSSMDGVWIFLNLSKRNNVHGTDLKKWDGDGGIIHVKC